MKPLLSGLLATLFAMPTFADLYDAAQLDNIYENERAGLRMYESGEHRKAFKLLKRTAAQGMKRSQYVLGFMFLKGEGVDKNMLFGLAWVGLATEAKNDGWQQTFDGLYNTLNAAQKSMVDDKIEEYRKKFGAAAQGITCARASAVGSRRQDIICRKSEGSYVEYDIEISTRP